MKASSELKARFSGGAIAARSVLMAVTPYRASDELRDAYLAAITVMDNLVALAITEGGREVTEDDT